MTSAQAELLLAHLTAAWPWASWPPPTVALYRGELERLPDLDIAEQVVVAAVRGSDRPPSVAALLTDYRRVERRRDDELERAERQAQLSAGAQPIPDDVLAELGRLGVDVSRLVRSMDPGKAA